MLSPLGWFVVGCVTLLLALFVLRRGFARRGSGRLAQLEFRRRHGEEVARLLDGSPDPRPGSPWIAIRVGGRPARMVAAPIARDELQAGVELIGHDLHLDVFHTTGELDELYVPDGVDVAQVLAVVSQLRELGVDNVARPAPGGEHVLRLRFATVAELAERLARVAPLLAQLEQLAPADAARDGAGVDQPPNDWAQ